MVGVVGRTTYYKELNSRLGRCSVGLLGFDDNLDLVIRQSGLQLFGVFLPLHLAIGSPLLGKPREKCEEDIYNSYINITAETKLE